MHTILDQKDGLWTLAYIIQSNSGAHPLTAYLKSGIQQERNASFPANCIAMTKVTGCSTPYRAGLIDDWETLLITKVMFKVFKNAFNVINSLTPDLRIPVHVCLF